MKTTAKREWINGKTIVTRFRSINIGILASVLTLIIITVICVTDRLTLVIVLISVSVLYVFASVLLSRRFLVAPLGDLAADSVTNGGGDTVPSVSVSGGEAVLLAGGGRGEAVPSAGGVSDGVDGLARVLQGALTGDDEAGERVRLILEAMPLGCTMIDRELNFIDCNIAAARLLGFEDKQEYMSRFFELSPEYQPDGMRSTAKAKMLVSEAFETGGCFVDWIHQLVDGTLVPAEVTFVRVKYGSDNIVVGFTRDMREYKRMIKDIEQRDILLSTVNNAITYLLQAEPDEFPSALQSSMGIMAGAVEADRVRLWKNSVENGKLCCTQLYEWVDGGDGNDQDRVLTVNVPYDEALPGWENSLSNGWCINSLTRDTSPVVKERLSKQGILSLLIVPVFLQDKFWGFVGFNDCRQERMFTANAESILRSASLLIANALSRNEMTQELEAALEKTRAASQAKGNFLSIMSHEIRTPINAIVGMTIIGKSATSMEKKNYAFDKIDIASSHLLGVINDVLDMSKIEANKFELSNVEFDIEKMLQKVINVIVFRVNEKSQKLTVKLDPKIPHSMVGDDQRLAQVITNLLSNAVKFTPEKGSISLRLQLVEEKNGLCTIQSEVADSGIGISKEQIKRLFTSFEQAESSTSRKYGGTGLGLAICKQIVGLMRGNIWVESELGKGSSFKFTAKLERAATKEGQLAQAVEEGIRVLFAAGDPETREYYHEIIQRMGITCTAVPGISEALEALEQNGGYNVCFVDWMMPGVNGIELSCAIKARGLRVPVVILASAYEWNSIEKAAMAAGVSGFLTKPLFSSEIINCISDLVGEKAVSVSDDTGHESVEDFSGYHILLVEDVEINREIVQTLLEPTQIKIDCAVNGLEAVQSVEASPGKYDMIFMDMQMPEMDGLTATQHIRALDMAGAKEVPIIAMTANVFKDDVEKCLEAGMNDHIGKPINVDDMLKKLTKYLQPKS